MTSDDDRSISAEEGAYGQAPSPGGGYGSTGVQRPPIAYYNNQTGGVVVTPPKSLFVNFGKDMDKVLQVGPARAGVLIISLTTATTVQEPGRNVDRVLSAALPCIGHAGSGSLYSHICKLELAAQTSGRE